jgi:hypothetical protein
MPHGGSLGQFWARLKHAALALPRLPASRNHVIEQVSAATILDFDDP